MKNNQDIKDNDILLSPYAARSSSSLGRKYKEEEHPYRNVFQRDRDRIIHSTAFRRLEYKTQVFIYGEGDHYRNRLTHTLEVQQIARTIARTLKLNEDLVESISLAHDIGHTPFGHKGELVLDKLMKEHKFPGFEHNEQGLKVVDKIEERYPDFPGLNLTYEVREGIIRHKTSYDRPLIDEYQEFTKFTSPSLEAQVVNVSDEIAYTCHDLDDGIRSGIISFKEIEKITLWKEIEKKVNIEKIPEKHKRHVMIRNFINYLVSDVICQSIENIEKSGVSSIEDVRNTHILITHSEEVIRKHTQLRKFLEENMYENYRIIRMAKKATMIITDLFKTYLSEPKQLPPHIQKKMEYEPKEIVICDYIAGMTDRFAQLEYQKLFNLESLV